MAEEQAYKQEDIKNDYAQPAAGSANAFEAGKILYAADVKALATAVEESANAEKVAGKMSDLKTVLEQKIDGTQLALNSEISQLQGNIDESLQEIGQQMAARGTGLYFDESKKTLHMVYEDGTVSSEGIKVATDLTGYATEQHVEQRLNVGTDKTVKQYVDEKVATVDLSRQLENYYTKPQVDIMDVDVVDQGQTIGIALRGADGVMGEYHSFPKATNSEYYRITPVTANTFNTIPGNDMTPQKIQYKVGHMRGESGWGNEIYFERWTTQVDGVTTNTITRSNYFVDLTGTTNQEFDFIPYLGDGTTAVTLEIFVTNDYSSGAFKGSNTWQVTKVNFDLSVEFPSPKECGTAQTIKCSLPSGTEKIVSLVLDGATYDTVTVAENTISYDFVLTSYDHGAKRVEVTMETTMDGQTIPAIPEVGSVIWYDKTNPLPIIAIEQTIYNVEQYDIVPITFLPYAYFDGSDKNNLNFKVYSNESGEDVLIADETITSSISYTWNYPAELILDGIQLTLVLSHNGGTVEKILTINVTAGSYNFEAVAGENFAFIPRKYSNNSFVNDTITISEGVILELSENFNLNSGGFGKNGETTYFKIPAYNRVRISGKKLFNDSYDSHFKLVFKTENARYDDVTFLATGSVDGENEFTASTNGIRLTTNHGYVQGNDTLKATSVFTPDEIIDYAFNIVNPTKHSGKTYTTANNGKIPTGYREGDYKDLTLEKYMIMPYEDGVASLPSVYTEAAYESGFFANVGEVVEIGSDDCDVYIYSLRSYNTALGIDDICKNFVADGTTLAERRARYDRNNWNILSNNILKDPELASKLIPDIKIVLITAPKFTNDKKDEIGDTYVQVLQNTVTKKVNGKFETVDEKPFNWITKGGTHSGQGTSSNAYGFSGRNLTLTLGDIVYEGATSIYSPTNPSHGELETFATTKGWTQKDSPLIQIKPDGIPINIVNIKVNIASSENANNAQMAELYNKLNNEIYKRPAKLRDEKVRDTIGFDNCLIYVRETSANPTERREFLIDDDESWHFYGIGNFGDHKDTDVTRVDHKWNGSAWVKDEKETIVEILDYNVPLAGFNPITQKCGIKPFNHASASVIKGEYVEVDKEDYPTFGDLLNYKTTKEDLGTYRGLYTWDTKKNKYKFEGFGVLSKQELIEPDEGDDYYEESLECSYEFRYEMEDISKSQRDKNIENWIGFYTAIYDIYNKLDTKVYTVDQAIAKLGEYMITDSAILYHVFTERFSLIDNRAKNSFWHYSKKYYTKTEAAGLDSTKYASMIDDEKGALHGGYRWDLCFGYDFDTSLGIDNVGKLAFDYGQETTSREFRTEVKYLDENLTEQIQNGFSYFFELINNFGYKPLSDIYNATSTTSVLFNSSGADGTIMTWDNAQKQIPEKIWLRDVERKYLRTSGNFQLDGSITRISTGGYSEETLLAKTIDTSFLVDKANGLKRYHRHDFEKKQSIYMGSRWAEGARPGYVDFRFETASAPAKVIVGFSQKCYFSYTTELSGSDWSAPRPTWEISDDETSYIKEITLTNAECLRVYPASEITILRFPDTYNGNVMKINQAMSFEPTKKLVEASFGTKDGSKPEINISDVTFDNCPLLEKLDFTNCIKFDNDGINREFSIYLTKNPGFRELLAEESGLVGVSFAPNGMLQTAKLNKIKKLSLVNLSQLRTLSIKNKDELTSLRLENCPFVDAYSLIINTKDTLTELRLVGIDWQTEVSTINLRVEGLFNELARKHGINDQGQSIVLDDPEHRGAVLAGYAKVAESSTRMQTKYLKYWPNMVFDYTLFTTEFPIYFHTNEKDAWEEGDTPLDEQWLTAGTPPTNPATREENKKIPTKEQTLTEVFDFETWSDMTVFIYGISEKTDIWPIFKSSPREYTIVWKGVNEETMQEDKVLYGQGAEYNHKLLGYPQKDPTGSVHYLFNGWDKYPYCIKEDGIILRPTFSEAVPGGVAIDGTLPDIAQLNATCNYGSSLNKVEQTPTDEGIELSTFEQLYLGLKEKTSVIIGWDPDDDKNCPEDRKPIFDLLTSECKAYKNTGRNATAYRFNKDNPIATIDSPLLLNHLADSYKYVDTGISLLSSAEDDEFTIILDYRFLDTEVNSGDYTTGTTKSTQKILSCCYEDSKGTSYQGFDIGRQSGSNNFNVYSSTEKQPINQNMELGSSNAGIAVITNPENEEARMAPSNADLSEWDASHADRVIIRKKKGIKELEIVPSYSWYTKTELEAEGSTNFLGDSSVRLFTIPLKGENYHSGTVTLGAPKKYTGTNWADSNLLCHASISGLKIWKIALSDIEIAKAANYPKEKLTFWLTEFPRINAHKQGRSQYSITNEDTVEDDHFPGVILELRDFLKNTRLYEGTIKEETVIDGETTNITYRTPTNFEGWMKTATREWLNSRVYEALPVDWRAAIKPVKVFQLIGTPNQNASGEPLTSGNYSVDSSHYDYLFNPSYQEMWPVALEAPYKDEGAPSSIAYDNIIRRKYYEVGGKWYNGFNRTRTPITTTTGFWRIEPNGGLGQGSSPNYKAWVTFAFCI